MPSSTLPSDFYSFLQQLESQAAPQPTRPPAGHLSTDLTDQEPLMPNNYSGPRRSIPPDFPGAAAITVHRNAAAREAGANVWWPDGCETRLRRQYLLRRYPHASHIGVPLSCNCPNCRARLSAIADLLLGPETPGAPTPLVPDVETHRPCNVCGIVQNRYDLGNHPSHLSPVCRTCEPTAVLPHRPAPTITITCEACNRRVRVPDTAGPHRCPNCDHRQGDPVPVRIQSYSYKPAGDAQKIFAAPGEPSIIPINRPSIRHLPPTSFVPRPEPRPNERIPRPNHLAHYFTMRDWDSLPRQRQLEHWRSGEENRRLSLQPRQLVIDSQQHLFIGCELEVAMPNTWRSENLIAVAEPHSKGLFYYKSDSSIGHGVELVTHPFSEAWYRQGGQNIIANVAAALAKNRCSSHKPGTCGFHIHLTKAAFSNLHLYKFATLWFSDPRAVEIISQRSVTSLAQWASLNHSSPVTTMATAKSADASGRRIAVNITSSTVELRVFRGNLRSERIHKNIECAFATYHFTKSAALGDLTWLKFSRWVQDQPKAFPHLAPFLATYLDHNIIAPETENI